MRRSVWEGRFIQGADEAIFPRCVDAEIVAAAKQAHDVMAGKGSDSRGDVN